MTKRLALIALICLSCSSSQRSVIVVSLSYDATVETPEAIKNLEVTVEGVVKTYLVPVSAPFQDCIAAAPCTLEIDTERPGRLDITIAGMGEISDGGHLVLGMGSGSATADANKVQTVPIRLSCASGGCGVVSGNDGGAGAGGFAGSGAGRGGIGGGAGGTTGVGGGVGGAGTAGGGGGSGSGGTAGATGAGGTAGVTGTAGSSGAAGTAGATGTGARGGAAGAAGSAGAAGGAGRGGAGGTGGAAGTTGTAGVGGRGGTGGAAGVSGAGGAGGTAGAGGTTGGGGRGGAGGTPVGANCVDSIKLNGYAWPPAAPCSACVDNGVSQASKCQSFIDCLEQNYPCTGNCMISCQNQAGANSVVLSCVNALMSAACN